MNPANASLTALLISLGLILFALAASIINEERKKSQRDIAANNKAWRTFHDGDQRGNAPDGLPSHNPNQNRK